MYGLILKLIYILLLAFMALSAFICLRDLLRGHNKSPLTISVVSMFTMVFVFLFQTSALPVVIVPLVAMVALPIFLTDKNRNWDGVDRVYRWVTLAAVLSALIMTINSGIR